MNSGGTAGRQVWSLTPWLAGMVSAEHIFRTPRTEVTECAPCRATSEYFCVSSILSWLDPLAYDRRLIQPLSWAPLPPRIARFNRPRERLIPDTALSRR